MSDCRVPMVTYEKPKHPECYFGNRSVYCAPNKWFQQCRECWPCSECEPCAGCDEDICPYAEVGNGNKKLHD